MLSKPSYKNKNINKSKRNKTKTTRKKYSKNKLVKKVLVFSLCIKDVHNRYRTEAHSEIVARFNERFILSLASCKSCVALDDRFNVLPISSHIAMSIERITQPVKVGSLFLALNFYLIEINFKGSTSAEELIALQEAMADTAPIGALLKRCRTACQARVLLKLLDVLTEKSRRLDAICSVTAARGRGKSAALGLSIAGAIGFGLSNLFVTSPTPENLRTLFEFILKASKKLHKILSIDLR